MNDPFAQLTAANQDLQVRAAMLRGQVIRRLRARRAALRPALLSRLGSGVKQALGALMRSWHEPAAPFGRRAGAESSGPQRRPGNGGR